MEFKQHLWKEQEHTLRRSFVFPTFILAINFVTGVAALSEKHHHHPIIHIDYTSVSLSLSTHDDGNIITAKDHLLAAAIDLFYQEYCL
ncbi:4a-hydroxytetrahydrobiopterin dehydratase [Schleiferiaceae bacterium]|nr:4a-hydroxytetrahydrobiopterin dehydratase [Schleiferiaceae bacterium]